MSASSSLDRLPNPRLSLRRCSPHHLRRHRRHRPLDLVRPRQPPLPRRRLPLRRLHLRPHRPPLRRYHRRRLRLPRHDHLLHGQDHERLHRRHGLRGHRGGNQRTHCLGRHVRAGAHGEAREVCCGTDLYYHSVLSVGAMGAIDRRAFELAVDWTVVRDLELHWVGNDGRVLFPAA